MVAGVARFGTKLELPGGAGRWRAIIDSEGRRAPEGEACPEVFLKHRDALDNFIERANRRKVAFLAGEQLLGAVSVFFGGAVLVLLVGAQILNWYWPVLLASAALVFGFVRMGRRKRSRYQLAQQIDRRLALHDSLSTALYFRDNPGRATSAEMRVLQERQAAALAGSLSPHAAVPYFLPRAAYTAVLALLVAGTLVGIRYGVLHTLDTRQPLVAAALDLVPFLSSSQRQAKLKKAQSEDPRDPEASAEGRSRKEEMERMARNEVMGFSTGQSSSATAQNTSAAEMEKQSGADASAANQQQYLDAAGGKAGSSKQGDHDKARPSDVAPPNSGRDQNQNGAQAKSPEGGEQNSLFDKMRDALKNLMAKMNQNGAGEQSKQAAKSQVDLPSKDQEDQQSENGNLAQGQTGIQGPDSQQADPNGQGDQATNSSREKSQRATSVPSPKNGNSGIGSANGDKSVHLAEQQEAMGKISEILGRRSLDLTGEVTVEVKNANQALKTQYTRQGVRTPSSGGEVRRDEIPLEYQPYVQKYFEQVRKLPPVGKPAEPRTTPAAGSQ